ncbi:MAG TPA: oxygenase MpaB family protein [Stackebrandtia sp.]|jgi:uncharacterized protein (DUF2236 family)|uniref:oxygenase MpaB family protein n=1 Tax=Stackebrandtia sp. TaxID=2023065 RepID=UPI002D2B18DF|nr:oxygenase MpaB family protein [Stackebrandtia sp.]HZE41589.1 oxygenase MpaB family protein [Stackebrandtia sp.]
MEEDCGLFGPGSVTWRTNIELVMWIGGLRALYLQSLHPKVMRGTYQNSALFDKKKGWARFVRTAQFVHVRTYGTTAEAEKAGARVRAIHAGLTGHDPDTGRDFRLDEPDGLLWVHCAEVDSYVDVARRAGVLRSAGEADAYVAEHRATAELVGIERGAAPSSTLELGDYFRLIRPELYACTEAIRGLWNSFNPPVPRRLAALRLAVPPANLLALATLPGWAKRKLGVPNPPGASAMATAQLRLVRAASAATRRQSTEEVIAEAREAAHQMSGGTFTSPLLPA